MKKYINSIENENTKIAILSLVKKINLFMQNRENKNIYDMEKDDIDEFLKYELSNKSHTTIYSTISRIRDIFNNIGKEDCISHLTLDYIRSLIVIKNNTHFSPSEVYQIINGLLNFQDKALVLLVYAGLYDADFKTIRHLKCNQIFKDKIVLDDREIKINRFIYYVLCRAMEETRVNKYIFHEYAFNFSSTYELAHSTEYVIKSAKRKNAKVIVPAVTLKKRFETYGRYLWIDKLTPIMVKNSRLIYDLVKLEYKYNEGLSLGQLGVKDTFKTNNISASPEIISKNKDEIRKKILTDIVEKKDKFIAVK